MTLSPEAREHIEALLSEAAKLDGSAAQDLAEFRAFLSEVDEEASGVAKRKAMEEADRLDREAGHTCVECNFHIYRYDDAICEDCFEKAGAPRELRVVRK